LKSYRKIRSLFNTGERFRQHPFLVYYSINPQSEDAEEDVLQMGVSVGTKNFKKAVTRNLLKRRTREVYRKNKKDLKEVLIEKKVSMGVFFVYINTEISEYAEIELAMKSILKKLASITSNSLHQQINKSTNQQLNN
jgi:ribonuclease P protein component